MQSYKFAHELQFKLVLTNYLTKMLILTARRANLSVRALFGWIVLLSSLNLVGAALGVSVPLISGCVRSVLYQGRSGPSESYFDLSTAGYSCSAGLLINVIWGNFLGSDLASPALASLVLSPLGSLFLIVLLYLTEVTTTKN